MLIQLNTANHVDGWDEAMREVETDLLRTLDRFSSQLTRSEVHFRDTSAGKAGASDKECTLEARVSGQDPTAVTHAAATLSAAFYGARDKLVRVLDKRVAKRRPPKGIDSYERPALDQGMAL